MAEVGLRTFGVVLVRLFFLTLGASLIFQAATLEAAQLTYGFPIEEVRGAFFSVVRELNGGVVLVKGGANHFQGTILEATCELRFTDLSKSSTGVDLEISAADPKQAATLKRLLLNIVQTRLAGQQRKAPEVPSSRLEDTILAHRLAVVCIFGTARGQSIQTSGVAISPDGLILTTAHDLLSADHLVVQLADGKVGKGRVMVSETRYDLAVVASDLPTPDYVSIATAQKEATFPAIGSPIWNLGCPFGLAETSAEGRVTSPPRLLGEALFLQSDLPAYPGSSGSPVFDAQGSLVAVVKGRLRGFPRISFLIPSFYAGSLLAGLEKTSVLKEKPQTQLRTASDWLIHALAVKDRDLKEKALLQALRLDQDLPAALYHLGVLYGTWPEKRDQELQAWERLGRLRPDWGEIHLRVGNCYFRSGRLDDAEQAYRRAQELISEDPRVSNNLGEIMRRKGRWREAERTLRQALALDPDYAPAHYNLGILYDRDLNRPERALYHYRQYLRLNPSAEDAKLVEAWIREVEGRL
jgi:S1-C subfamily serine protease